jgi:hypothetical protein
MSHSCSKANVLLTVGSSVAAVAAAASAVIGGCTLWQARQLHREGIAVSRELQDKQSEFAHQLEEWRIARQEPTLVNNSVTPEPLGGRPGVTNVAVKNVGEKQALVTEVVFVIGEKLSTPREGIMVGGVEAIPLYFGASDLAPDGSFRRKLRTPRGVPGGGDLVFWVAVVEAKWRGSTYRGDVVIYYDQGKSVTVPEVTIDVHATEPRLEGLAP